MSKSAIRCGNSNAIYQAAKRTVEGAQAAPPRTPLHIGSPLRAAREFRVVARLRDGGLALVCAGDTREEVARLARERWGGGLKGVEGLFLEKWSGPETAGSWVGLKPGRDELPRVFAPPRRLRPFTPPSAVRVPSARRRVASC